MRVLITGAGGQLGTDLQAAFSAGAHHELVAVDRAHLDVGDRDAVASLVGQLAPDLVVNCAAWTAVDACESDPDRAWRTNSLAVRHLAEAAERARAHLVQVSTDYVFDGTKADPYVEWDPPCPLSVYGRSKLGGELEAAGLPGSTIVRTSWVLGPHGSNMLKTLLRLAAGDGPLAFVDDQRGCPTFTDDLAGAIYRLAVGRRAGLFHVTNQGPTTWYGFARDVLAAAGHDPGRVVPISTAELDPPRPARRPASSVLDNAALRLAGEPLLADHHEALERNLRRLIG